MSTKNINFTKEHLTRLQDLSLKALFNNSVVKGKLGSELDIHTLLHSTSISSLVDLHRQIKKEVDTTSNLDEWSMNDYQQRKLDSLKESQELINLLIGYKKHLSQTEAAKAENAEIKAQIKELEESTMTPEARIEALKAKLNPEIE